MLLIDTFQIYTILSICLGTPPKTFTWEYYDKDKKYQKIGPISPKEFYHSKIKPLYNMQDKVSRHCNYNNDGGGAVNMTGDML
jgi:bleomycin hydrolase